MIILTAYCQCPFFKAPEASVSHLMSGGYPISGEGGIPSHLMSGGYPISGEGGTLSHLMFGGTLS